MELGAEISQKVKKTIKKQLKTLGCYVDDELPEYIMVMIANKRTQEQMVEDLQLFLNDEAEKFVAWLTVVLSRIKKAMELPDIDALVGDVEMEQGIEEKSLELKNENKNSLSEEEKSVRTHKSDDRRRSRDGSRRESEEKDRENRHHQPRGDRHKSKEDDRRERERKQRTDDRSRRDREREEEAKKRRDEREEEISKRRAAREKRYQEEKERKERRDHHSDDKDRKNSEEHEEHKRSRDDSKRSDNRPSRNPMEFVKQIARDISDQLTSNDPESTEKEIDGENNSNGNEIDANAEQTQNENVLLQAVSQYNDVEGDTEKIDGESQKKVNNHHSEESHKKSDNHSHSEKPRSHSKSESDKHSKKSERSRKSKSPSAERRRKHSKDRSGERGRKDIRRSSSRRDKDKEDRHRHGSSRDDKSDKSESRHRGRSRSPRRKSSSHKERDAREEEKKPDLTDEEEEEEEEHKPSLSSQVQVFTDFKRKPSLSKHNQASNILLKRAVTEVVNDRPDGEENEDDVELDYNETDDENEFYDDRSNEVIERRVINFDGEKSGLPTITVNFNQDTSSQSDKRNRSKSDERNRYRNGNQDSRHSQSKHHSNHNENIDHRLHGISKYDARYTILRSRTEPNNDRRVRRHSDKHERSSNHEKSLSSMVADLEERTRQQSDHGSAWKERRNSRESSDTRHRDSSSHRKHHSSHLIEEKEDRHHRAVKERRIEMHDNGGDLRNLLSGKKVERKSSSDDDSSTRRLREKLKAEKHKMLFGKLKPDERDRSNKESEHLAEKLKSKSRKRKVTQTETTESPEWIEKITDYVENVSDLDDDEEDAKKEEDEWEVLNEAFEPYGDDDSSNPVTEAPDDEEEEEEDAASNQESSNVPSEGNVTSSGSNTPDNSNESNEADNSKNLSKNDLEEVSDEELNDESEHEADGERVDEDDEENIDFEASRGSNEILGRVDGEDETDEVVEIEVDVSENENFEAKGELISQSRINDVNNGSTKRDISKTAGKESMHTESSEDSAFQDENHDVKEINASSRNLDKYERKSKSKSSKRKRMRHEFIVTLEGLGEGKKVSIETAGREKSSKVRHLSDRRGERHSDRRHRHMRRSQSDEEFEEILRRKEAEEKRFDSSRNYESRRSHRSRSHSSEKESKHRESRVNREIMLAENKLKTQKVFKKCLETVKNVTNNLTVGSALTAIDGTHTAAFINPNFAHKLQVGALNPVMIPGYDNSIKVLTPVTTYPSKPICTLAVGEKIILQSTVLTPNRDTIAVKPLRIERSKDYVMPTPIDIAALPPINTTNLNKDDNSISTPTEAQGKEKENIQNIQEEQIDIQTETHTTIIDNVEDGNTVSLTSENINTTSLTSELPVNEDAKNTTVVAALAPTKPTIQERCVFWPNCKNQSCPYIHPSVNCKLFPNCSYGQHCIYIHPPCMFAEACSNAACPFMHVQTNPQPFTGYTQICKFYPNCVKADCPFKHVSKPCRYGSSCNNVECSFSHDDVHAALPSSSLKWVAEKPHVSERKFAAAEAIVTHMPVPIVTST